MRNTALISCISLSLSGCATIIEGTDQWIAVAVNVPGATCEAWRNGALQDSTTPQKDRLKVTKSKDDLQIKCSAPGFDTKTVAVESSVSAAGMASVLAIDFGATDYMTGALNKYPDAVIVNLSPTAKQPSMKPTE